MYRTLLGYRAMLGLNQKQLASKMGMSASNYSKKENDIIKFRIDEMIKITDIIKKEFPNATMDHIFNNK